MALSVNVDSDAGLTLCWLAQNADANSLIPVDLSPIKKDVAKKSSVLSAFGGGGAGRKGASIFA